MTAPLNFPSAHEACGLHSDEKRSAASGRLTVERIRHAAERTSAAGGLRLVDEQGREARRVSRETSVRR